ncbi:unnamed protein product [Prorocentrum cordatum]|uniref:Tc1-like transposase DDE domain-containing protein n=1 Tax=Prorocentrum cordatum TaxID=2364126 RepID=A0ABN9PE93_9DINO|nr:unnamed protein product [Polarella glacialis]
MGDPKPGTAAHAKKKARNAAYNARKRAEKKAAALEAVVEPYTRKIARLEHRVDLVRDHRQDFWEQLQKTKSGEGARRRTCNGDEVSAVKGTILAGTPTSLWMNKLDAFVMWCFDYSLGTLKGEVGVDAHATVERWIQTFEEGVEEHMARKMDSASIFADLLGGGPRKRPAAAKAAPKRRAKRSAKSRPAQAGVKKRPVMKRPARSRLPAARTRKVILQVDESFLNKGKLSKLAKNARPKKDKLWLWGAVVQGSPHLFFFKVLKSVEGAYDGKPRGKQELLENFKELSPPAGVVIVSDKWRGTIAAVKQYRNDAGLTERMLPHEVVNHSAGEITNERGFTTNHVELQWPLVKRWIRKRYGGTLPKKADRKKWSRLLAEHKFRTHIKASGQKVSFAALAAAFQAW